VDRVGAVQCRGKVAAWRRSPAGRPKVSDRHVVALVNLIDSDRMRKEHGDAATGPRRRVPDAQHGAKARRQGPTLLQSIIGEKEA